MTTFKDIRNRNASVATCEVCRERPVAGALTVAVDEPRGRGQQGGSKRIAAETAQLCEPCAASRFLACIEVLNPRPNGSVSTKTSSKRGRTADTAAPTDNRR